MKLDDSNAEAYLLSHGHLATGEHAEVRLLSGGVSNLVLHVARTGADDFVLKQAREQLNVAEPWFCSIDRIWREVEVLEICERVLSGSTSKTPLTIEVPRLLFDDRDNYLYAMSAAPRNHVVWKHELLSGITRREVAVSCGTMLGRLHAGTWHNTELAQQLNDRQYFDDLRLDPYYRQIARMHADLAPAINELIDSVWHERYALVHGDFSPKNLLVHDNRLMLIDFEVGHYGDPAFDLGFFLTHLVLKAFYHAPVHDRYFELIDAFWQAYRVELSGSVPAGETEALFQRAVWNFAGCALARLDGKSKVEYFTHPARRDDIRQLCRTIFLDRLRTWDEVNTLAIRLLEANPDSRASQPQPVML